MIFKKVDLKTADFISIGPICLDNSELFRLITKYNDCNATYYYLFDKILIWKRKKIKTNNQASERLCTECVNYLESSNE